MKPRSEPATDALGFAFPVYGHGRVFPADSRLVVLEDQGFQLGLALFETLLVESRHAYFLAAHLARLEAGCARLGLAWPGAEAVRSALGSYLQSFDELSDGASVAPERFVLRITLSAGAPGAAPALWLSARQRRPLPSGELRLWLSEQRLLQDELAALKSNNRLRFFMAQQEAQAQACFDALLLNQAGEVAETTTANLLVYAEGLLLTPPLDSGCLAGITRQLLLDELEREPLRLGDGRALRLQQGPLTLGQLETAKEICFCNSVQGLVPVDALVGCPFPAPGLAGRAGELQLALQARLQALQRIDRGA